MVNNYKGYSVITSIEANKDDKGIWRVKHVLKQGRKIDSETEWEYKDVEVTALDADVDEAVKQTIVSISYYLDMVDGDLFNELKSEEDNKELLQ